MLNKPFIKIFSCIFLSSLSLSAYAEIMKGMPIDNNSFDIYIGALYLKPKSNNLKYAVFVAGNQPYSQSWYNEVVDPSYSPAFELGLNYHLSQSKFSFSVDWLHLNTSNSDSKQTLEGIDPATIEFVAPPYDVGPAVFGIKHAESTVDFNFNSVLLNVNKIFEYNPNFKIKLFGGINILRIRQTINTTFSDFPGMAPTELTYGLPADPNFNFNTENSSKYLGAGPDMGLNMQYQWNNGLGVVGQFIGTLTAGTIHAKDEFTSTSSRLIANGIGVSHQSITTPNTLQVVPGFDAKLGLLYDWKCKNTLDFTIEGGYRIAYYINAISEVEPATLVQPGQSFGTPEFSTGTMAINSTEANDLPFSFNGIYLNFKVSI